MLSIAIGAPGIDRLQVRFVLSRQSFGLDQDVDERRPPNRGNANTLPFTVGDFVGITLQNSGKSWVIPTACRVCAARVTVFI